MNCIAVVIGLMGVGQVEAAEKVSTQIQFRGIAAREAFEKIGNALQERVVISRQVPADALDRDIRLETEYLAPDQAVRWVARLVELEAVRTREGYYIATPEQLREMNVQPQGQEMYLLALSSANAVDETTAKSAVPPNLARVLTRTGPLFWQDTPLTRAAADMARVFEIDLIVHPQILAEGVLLEWEQPQATLRAACQYLAEALAAAVEFRDGALWVHRSAIPASQPGGTMDSPVPIPPAAIASAPAMALTQEPSPGPSAVPVEQQPPTSRPAPRVSEPPGQVSPVPVVARPAESRPAARAPDLPALAPPNGRLTVDESIRDWSSFAQHLETATGWVCRPPPSGEAYEPIAVDGPADQVLAVLKLMGRLDYRYIQSDRSAPPTVELRARRAR